MFTGIIEELATTVSLVKTGSISKLQVLASRIAQEVQPGQSICLNGVCLTAVGIKKELLSFEIMPETVQRTSLSLLRKGSKVNLERALRVDARIDGHFVTGHIDGTGRIKSSRHQGGSLIMEIECPEQILRYIVFKGSVALEGISLTVSALNEQTFAVNLIPYTLKNTTLGLKKENELVNIECDILGKYIDKFLTQNKRLNSSLTQSFLKEHGFLKANKH